jgi:hypothetical protein
MRRAAKCWDLAMMSRICLGDGIKQQFLVHQELGTNDADGAPREALA